MSSTDKAIEQIRELIRTGALPPGSKLPPEPDLAAQLGLSRNLARLNAHDAAFHHAVVSATGNETLLTLLEAVSGRTLRARIWRGLVDPRAAGRTLAEHEAIFDALSTHDAALSQAAVLPHVSNTERWLRAYLGSGEALLSGTTLRKGEDGRCPTRPLATE